MPKTRSKRSWPLRPLHGTTIETSGWPVFDSASFQATSRCFLGGSPSVSSTRAVRAIRSASVRFWALPRVTTTTSALLSKYGSVDSVATSGAKTALCGSEAARSRPPVQSRTVGSVPSSDSISVRSPSSAPSASSSPPNAGLRRSNKYPTSRSSTTGKEVARRCSRNSGYRSNHHAPVVGIRRKSAPNAYWLSS